jgi:hypothetical protein
MALGSAHPLTEMSTRKLSVGNVRPKRKADNLTAICEPTVKKMWEPRRLTTLWASTASYRDRFTFTFYVPDYFLKTILRHHRGVDIAQSV